MFDGFPNKAGHLQTSIDGHTYNGNYVHGLREGLVHFSPHDCVYLLSYLFADFVPCSASSFKVVGRFR